MMRVVGLRGFLVRDEEIDFHAFRPNRPVYGKILDAGRAVPRCRKSAKKIWWKSVCVLEGQRVVQIGHANTRLGKPDDGVGKVVVASGDSATHEFAVERAATREGAANLLQGVCCALFVAFGLDLQCRPRIAERSARRPRSRAEAEEVKLVGVALEDFDGRPVRVEQERRGRCRAAPSGWSVEGADETGARSVFPGATRGSGGRGRGISGGERRDARFYTLRRTGRRSTGSLCRVLL